MTLPTTDQSLERRLGELETTVRRLSTEVEISRHEAKSEMARRETELLQFLMGLVMVGSLFS